MNYLHDFNPYNNTPFFYMDLLQDGIEPSFFLNGEVSIVDPDDGSIEHVWALDNVTQDDDGDYDDDAYTLAFGEIGFTGTSGTDYLVNHNQGSGKVDFIAFAPTMDLSLFNPDDLFVVHFNMEGLNAGPEEIMLTGATSTTRPVPEPATMFLLGTGLIGLAGFSKKKFKK